MNDDEKPKNSKCGIALYGRKPEIKHGKTARAGCNKWACPTCAERKKRKLMARAIIGMQAYPDKEWFFVTLTAPSYARNFQASLKAFRSGWRKVYKAMKAAHKSYALAGDFMMLKVYERHEDGTLHCHIITDINWQSRKTRKADKKRAPYTFMYRNLIKRKNGSDYYRSAFLSDKCAESGLGYIGECRPIIARDGTAGFVVASYIAKYIGKDTDSGNGHWPKSAHRVEFSANWPILPPLAQDDPFAWQVASRPAILHDKLDHWTIDDDAGIFPLLGF